MKTYVVNLSLELSPPRWFYWSFTRCFYGEMWKNIPQIFLLPLLIWSTVWDGTTVLTWLGSEWSPSCGIDNEAVHVRYSPELRMRWVCGGWLWDGFLIISVKTFWFIISTLSVRQLVRGQNIFVWGGDREWHLKICSPFFFLSRALISTSRKQREIYICIRTIALTEMYPVSGTDIFT